MDTEFVKNSPQFDEKCFNIGDAYLITEDIVEGDVLRYYGILVNWEPLQITFKILDKRSEDQDYMTSFVDKIVSVYSVIDGNINIIRLVEKKESTLEDSSLF